VTPDELPSSASNSERFSPIDTLLRWEARGAVWRVTSRTSSQVTVSLLSCDGGEEVDTIVSADPHLFRFTAERSASDE
jgi:hypothetical protein